jgi:predicted membrane protein
MKAYIPRFITGLAIVAFGVAFLLGNFEVLNFKELVHDWWPLAIILAGLIMLLNDARSYLWALLVIAIGVVVQLNQLDITDINPWQLFWPVAIIFVGLSVLFNKATSHPKVSKTERDDATAVLGGSDQRNTSDDFKGSKATAILGGVKLDLRKATIKKDATIEVFCFWGGVELLVPRNVTVRNQTSAVLGGIEDKTEQEAGKNAPVLYVTGDVIMGGVEIKNQ